MPPQATSPVIAPRPGTSTVTAARWRYAGTLRMVTSPSGESTALTGPTGVSIATGPGCTRPRCSSVRTSADQAVPAHAEIPDIVEEHDAGRRVGSLRRREERADDGVVAARLEHHRAAQVVLRGAHGVAAFGHGGAGGKRPTGDHDAGRLAFGVGVDDVDRGDGVHRCATGREASRSRIIASAISRSAPAIGRRGARTRSPPRPTSACTSLMSCTNLGTVSRRSSGRNHS